MDNYQISYYTETLFPNSEFKTDEILKDETLSYGAVVNDSYLVTCFRNLIAEDKFMLYDFTRKELTKTLKVISHYVWLNSEKRLILTKLRKSEFS